MRLLDARTLEVVEFMDHQIPEYAILSHIWITGQEVTILQLSEIIMKHSDDQTLLAWFLQEDDLEESGVLVTSPTLFPEC
jgi:hypothetical protein